MRIWRGYDPPNDEIIEKTITFAKKVILRYYDKRGENLDPEIRAFIDEERGEVMQELNTTLEYFRDKNNIMNPIPIEEWKFYNDRVMSSVNVYGKYLLERSGDLESEKLNAELKKIDKLLAMDPEMDSNYDIYTKLYIELSMESRLNFIHS